MTISIRSIKRTIVATVAVAAMCAASLRGHAQMRWGATVGGLVTDLHFKQDLAGVDKVPGFSAGVLGEIIFPGVGFGLDVGAQYEMRGANLHLGDKLMWSSQGYGDNRFFMHYLSVPIHLRFKYTRLNGFEEYLAPLAFVGPEFGFLVGHSKCDAFSFPFGEVGLEFGLGAEIYRRWQVTVQYNLGMTYVTKADVLTNYSAQNREWKVALTYFF